MIRDLLNPALGYLDLREDSKGIIQVAGITEVSTINAKEVGTALAGPGVTSCGLHQHPAGSMTAS